VKPAPIDVAAVAVNVLELRKRRAAHLGALDVLQIVEQLERVHGLIESSKAARRFMGVAAGDDLLNKAQLLLLDMLGINDAGERRSPKAL
jgi:hypothetical protein